ncbi:MAG: nitroreductase family protein [Caldilineaceae bacterium]
MSFRTFARLVGCLNEGNVPWASPAPVLGLVVAQTVRDNGRANRTAFYDAGLAMQNLAIQATARGLALRQMGGFRPIRPGNLRHSGRPRTGRHVCPGLSR